MHILLAGLALLIGLIYTSFGIAYFSVCNKSDTCISLFDINKVISKTMLYMPFALNQIFSL